MLYILALAGLNPRHVHHHVLGVVVSVRSRDASSRKCSQSVRRTGRKSDPVSVAQQMRVARGSDWQRQFTPKELLTANQIQGFFSRRAKSKNQATVEAEDDFAAAEVEDAMTNVRNEALNQTQPIHPVTFDGYNLCDLVARGRLCKLTVPLLRDICCYFELGINVKSLQMPRRKAPYVEILEKHFNFAAYLVKKYCFARAFNAE